MTRPGPHDAGVAHAAPASSSVGPRDVVPAAAHAELVRVRRRLSELGLSDAERAEPELRAVVEAVAARTAPGVPVPTVPLPVVAEQLAAVVWDAYADGCGDGVEELLTGLRRALP